jgi:tetratricopeptide (TPR) repeat protein
MILLAAFVAVGMAIYLPALSGELIWDDKYLVGENPLFRSPSFGVEVFRHWLFFDSFSTYYRPVQNWSYLFDYWLWRGKPFGYHLTNVLLHGTSGFLLFLLLRRLLPGLLARVESRGVTLVAALVALIWVVHPIHNAAVAYISGRADSLASLFALLAWLLTLRVRKVPRREKKIAFAGAAVLCATLALCSKEIALVWLGLFLLHLICFEKAVNWRQRAVLLGAVIGVFCAYAGLHSLPERRTPMQDAPPAPIQTRVLLMFRALGDYTGLICFPKDLYMERTLSDPTVLRSAQGWRESVRADHLSALGFASVLGAIALSVRGGPGQGLRRFGAVWFGAAFLPISNLFPLNAEVAEHWIYLASIGFLLFLAGCAIELPTRWQRCLVGFVSMAIVALAARTAVRAGDWVNAETFCQRTIATGGASPRLLATLAAIYAERGELPKQESLLRKMIERFPEFAPARIQLGTCLQRQGRETEAEPWLDLGQSKAVENARRFPRTWQAALQLARQRADGQRWSEALELVRAARQRFPDTWPLAEYEATLLLRSGDLPAALMVVEPYAAACWWHLDAWLMLGELRAESGAASAALLALRHATRLDLYDPRPLTAIARLELMRGRGDAAIEAQSEAIRRQPRQAECYFTLAAIFEQLGRRGEAEAAVRHAQSLGPLAARL